MSDEDQPQPAAGRSRTVRVGVIIAGAVPLAVGGFLGYRIAYDVSLGGMASLGAVYVAYGLGLLIGLAVIVGGIALFLRSSRGRRVSRWAFASAGLLAAGGVAGYISTPLAGLEYREPVVLVARGQASVQLEAIDAFEPRASSAADCRSLPDGEEVGGVSAMDLGELRGATLRGGFDTGLTQQAGEVVGISFFVDGADLPDGEPQPFWNGEALIEEVGPGATSGRVTFSGLPVTAGAMGEEGVQDWPQTLAGKLSWSCEPWLDPQESLTTRPRAGSSRTERGT